MRGLIKPKLPDHFAPDFRTKNAVSIKPLILKWKSRFLPLSHDRALSASTALPAPCSCDNFTSEILTRELILCNPNNYVPPAQR